VQADQPPLGTLRTFYALWSAENYVEAARLLFDPEIELVQPSGLPGGAGTYRGYEGLQQALGEWLEGAEYIHAEPEHFALGEGTAVVTVCLRTRGRHTGIEMDRRIGHLFRFRGEHAVRWEVYWSPEEALEAAGMS
jgi:ketosteroid isomerase-like protein